LICPCENCICMSICRHKRYLVLFEDCTILKKFESNPNIIEHRLNEKIILLEKVLQPSKWFIKTYHESNDLLRIESK